MSFKAANLNYVYRFADPRAEIYNEVVGPLMQSSAGILWVFDNRSSSLGLQVPGWWWVIQRPASDFAELTAIPQSQFIYSVEDGALAINIDEELMLNLELINVYGQIYWGPFLGVN